MNKCINVFTLAFTLLMAVDVMAVDSNALDISVRELTPLEVSLLEDSFLENSLQYPIAQPGILNTTDTKTEGDIDLIINIGQKIWKFIVDNKPVVNVKRDRATALPGTVRSALELDQWKGPSVKAYELLAKNAYGMQVIKLIFKLTYMHDGQYEGKGKYLTNVTVLPSQIEVSWGYTFNMDVVIAEVLNVGTKENPVGGISLELKYAIDTIVKHSEATLSFFIKGDGTMVQN